jgi:pimeloyl-ACP methyl ester carboxylesterase
MVIRGQNSDLLTEDTLEQMKKRGPGVAKVLIVDGVGHAPMLNTKEQVDAVKSFLFES